MRISPKNNSVLYGGKIIAQMVQEIIYFPVWWYTRGFVAVTEYLLKFLSDRQKSLAILVWIKNIHKPMYQQHDWQGILISVFMRIFQIIFRSIIMLFWLSAAILALAAWLVLPLFIVFQIFSQLIFW